MPKYTMGTRGTNTNERDNLDLATLLVAPAIGKKCYLVIHLSGQKVFYRMFRSRHLCLLQVSIVPSE